MTKAHLIDEVAHVAKMPREESEVIVEAIFERIVRSLHSGNKIEIRDFGSFGTRLHPPREIPNPKTGVRVAVPAKRIPYFEASEGLKKFVNNPCVPVAPPPEPAPGDRLRPDRRR
jgi:integration host factor subunit beta